MIRHWMSRDHEFKEDTESGKEAAAGRETMKPARELRYGFAGGSQQVQIAHSVAIYILAVVLLDWGIFGGVRVSDVRRST